MRRPSIAKLASAALSALAACGGETYDPSARPGADPRYGEVEQAATVCAAGTTLEGIDVSVWQGSIDWAQVAAAGKKFAIVRLAYGITKDTRFSVNYPAVKANGMIRGVYQYFLTGLDPIAQADMVIANVGVLEAGDLPVTGDIEEPGPSLGPAAYNNAIHQWANRIEQGTGKKPIIYTGKYYWDGNVNTSDFASYPLWHAQYTTADCPNISNHWSTWTFWQYRADPSGGVPGGTCPGISGYVDLDKFNGDLAALQALAGGFEYKGATLGISGQSYPIVSQGAVDVRVGETVTGWVKLRNAGTATWQPGVVKLAPIPRDQTSPYRSASWLSGHRISTISAPVAPGEVGTFDLDITGRDVGEAILSLGWVAEGITWFSDPPKGGGPPDGYFAVKVNVLPAPPGPDASVPPGPDASVPPGPDASLPPGPDASQPAGEDAGVPAGEDAAAPVQPDAGEPAGADASSLPVESDAAIETAGPDASEPAAGADAAGVAAADGAIAGQPDGATAVEGVASGCGCSSGTAGASAAPLALLMVSALIRRPRSRRDGA